MAAATKARTFTERELAQIEALGSVLSVEQIADYFGIGRTTFYAICERQPETLEHYKRGKSQAIASVSKGLLQQAIKGNLTAAIFYLKTQAGWRETANLNIGENKDSPLKITISPVDAIRPLLIESGKDES